MWEGVMVVIVMCGDGRRMVVIGAVLMTTVAPFVAIVISIGIVWCGTVMNVIIGNVGFVPCLCIVKTRCDGTRPIFSAVNVAMQICVVVDRGC